MVWNVCGLAAVQGACVCVCKCTCARILWKSSSGGSSHELFAAALFAWDSNVDQSCIAVSIFDERERGSCTFAFLSGGGSVPCFSICSFIFSLATLCLPCR